MKLRTLSVSSIAFCVLGLAVLLAISGYVMRDIQHKQSQVGALFELKQRVNSLSAAGVHLLLYYSDDELRQVFRLESDAVRLQLEELEAEHPGAGRVGAYIGLMQSMVDAEHARFAARTDQGSGLGPLGLPRRGRTILGQMYGHGIAMEAAVTALLQERQADIARQTSFAVGVFALASTLFGALCVVAFGLIHVRVRGPITGLYRVVNRLAAGDTTARVVVQGRDEIAELGQGFNTLLDEQDRTQADLRRYEQDLEERARMLAESQRIAQVGSMRLHIPTQRLKWSDESCRIFGLEPEEFAGTVDDFLSRIHPDDIDAFLEKRRRAIRGEAVLDASYRILRPDGSVRVIHQRAERQNDAAGEPVYLVGTLQDITEQQVTSERIRQQQRLLDMAGRVARIGGWAVNPDEELIYWSDTVCDIHDVSRGTTPTLAEGIAYYKHEYRDAIRELYERCVMYGTPFDTEMEVITALGREIWIRATGEGVVDKSGKLVRVQGALQDITAFKAAQLERQRVERQLRMTIDHVQEAFFTLDADSRFTYCNDEACRLLRRSREELIGAGIWELYPDLEHDLVGDAYRNALEHGEPVGLEAFRYEPLDGWFDIRAYPTETGLAVFFSDVSERYQMIARLREQETELRGSRDKLATLLASRQTLINSLPAHIALLDSEGFILDVNAYWRQFAQQNGFQGDDYGVGANYLSVCEEADGPGIAEIPAFTTGLRAVLEGRQRSFSLEYPCHSKTEHRWFRVTVNQLSRFADDRSEPGAVVMHMDITERKLAEQRLSRLAFEDPLTGALTRNGFSHELEMRMEHLGWDADGLMVMLDLINLRSVNDAHGFTAGDQLLNAVADRLRGLAGDSGLVGRVGGDEFMVYLAGRHSEQGNARRRLMAVFDAPFLIHGFTIDVVPRFGATRLGESPRPVEQLLREAELTLFQGTQPLEGHRWAAYTVELGATTRERVQLTQDLRKALENDELTLHFQPKVDLRSGAIVGAEALVRWMHPERGMIPPNQFIPLAEQGQLIAPLGQHVLESACRTVKDWQRAGLSTVPVAVNVSVLEFRLGDYPAMVRSALERHELEPELLSLEITESVFETEDEQLIAGIRTLKDLGLRLSLDDFGTGYSSLLYLKRYPFDEIKIDRGFVNGMLEDRYSREIVRIVISMSRVIGAVVVAEGVETGDERQALLDMGCGIAQGYHFSRPVPETEIRRLLKERVRLPEAPGPHGRH